MRSHLLAVPFLLLLFTFCGCQTARHSAGTPDPSATAVSKNKTFDQATRNNALALLDDLLNNEKNLSKILIIKRNSDELGRLVKEISKTAGEGADMVGAFTKNQPGLDLKVTSLPPGEIATRKAIAKTNEDLLLHSKDAEFEFQLLLTQVEALNYGAHLAMVVAENEPQADATRKFLALSAQLRALHEQVEAMLRTKK